MAILVLGSICSRSCGFCPIRSGLPKQVDNTEAERVAKAVASLKLSNIVISAVARDDLADGGAALLAATVDAIRNAAPACHIELHIPDFAGNTAALKRIIEAAPDVIGHNLESVPSLWPALRPQSDYRLSLSILKRLVEAGLAVKSGLMAGLGETRTEIEQMLKELAAAGVRSITIGQYVSPSSRHWPVRRYFDPAEFLEIAGYAQSLGFTRIISGPLVRSSHRGSFSKLAREVGH